MLVNTSDVLLNKDLISCLLSLVDPKFTPDYLCICARNKHGLTNVKVDSLQLGILLHGQKELKVNAQHLKFSVGDMIVMKPGAMMDAINIPDSETGMYLTIVVPICDEVIQAAKLIWGQSITDKTERVLKFSIHDFEAQLFEWSSALNTNNSAQARLCILAILMQLCHQGFADVLIPPSPSLSATIHKWVLSDPQRDWQSRDFEMELGLSGATLRRKLASEKTSLREIVTKARLANAITLLYSTKLPIKTVAAKSGYQSASAFRERFTHYYGVDPTVICNA